MDEKIVFFILKADGKIYVFRTWEKYREYQLWNCLLYTSPSPRDA